MSCGWLKAITHSCTGTRVQGKACVIILYKCQWARVTGIFKVYQEIVSGVVFMNQVGHHVYQMAALN